MTPAPIQPWRSSRRNLVLLACALSLSIPAAGFAQPLLPGDSDSADAIASRDLLLAEYGLIDSLAAGLRYRIARATGETRTQLAEQLSRLYAKMLSDATSSARRIEVEARCRELVKIAPEANSFALRLTIATAQYLPIEELVERRAMKMSTREDDAEAERVLRIVRPVFEELAAKLSQQAKQLREKKDRGIADEAEAELVQFELDEANSLRSRAHFYGGWCNYYTALLSGDKRYAVSAMDYFGGILNAVSGRPATVDRLPEGNLRYEHVAKAVVGCALASSLLGKHVEAERWLDALEQSHEVPPAVMAHFLRRQLTVFAAADRWADVKNAVTRARLPANGGAPQPLATPDARVLSVLALEGLSRSDLRPGLRTAAEEMAQIGLGDLVSRGEVGHVLSLVNTYGTAPIGKDGFINNYVRGLRAYDDAREDHKAAGTDPEAPAKAPNVLIQYRAAADLFLATTAAADAAQFAVERSRAQILGGLALYYAGDLDAAADLFEKASAEGATDEQRRDALWYAIVTLDLAVSTGKPSVAERRERLATLFVKNFPHSDRAVDLLLQRIKGGGRADRRDIETLLKVPEDSPLYLASRRVAARLLYKDFQRARPEDREFAVLRFAEVADLLLKIEFARATADHEPPAREAADDAIIHARQLADALLSAASPDAARAEAALSTIESIAAYHALDIRSIEAELAYNRLRIAWAKGDEAAAARFMDRVRATGGPYAAAAERSLYRRALDDRTANPADIAAAGRVVSSGSRVLLDGTANAEIQATVRDRVADAAFALWQAENDLAMRDVAVRTDRAQLEAGQRTHASLRRLAIALESQDQFDEALALWSELLAGLPEGTPDWFESRYESIRLLARSAPTDAAKALRQHKILRPTWGPAPWDTRFAELERQVGPPPDEPANPAPSGGGK